MKASELRAGNLIYRIEHIHEVGWNTIKLCDQRNKQFNEDFKPIQLTTEWLERLGFAYRNEVRGEGALLDLHNSDWKKSLTVGLDYKSNGGGIAVLCVGRNNIFYVHQLQNLYFALTGEELELKS